MPQQAGYGRGLAAIFPGATGDRSRRRYDTESARGRWSADDERSERRAPRDHRDHRLRHRAHLPLARRARRAVLRSKTPRSCSKSARSAARSSAPAAGRSAPTTTSCSSRRPGLYTQPALEHDDFDRSLMLSLCVLALRLDVVRYDAWHDPLTGLYDRRSFDRLLDMAIARGNRYGWQFTLVIIDLDSLKQINDTEGHPAGDAALRELGERFRQVLRIGDDAARHRRRRVRDDPAEHAARGGRAAHRARPQRGGLRAPVPGVLLRLGADPRRRERARRARWRPPTGGCTKRRRGDDARPRSDREGSRMNSLDDLELELRKLPGVKAAGFDEREDMLLVQLHVGDQVDSPEHPVPIDASRIVARHIEERTAVEIVRWRAIPGRGRVATAAPTSPRRHRRRPADAAPAASRRARGRPRPTSRRRRTISDGPPGPAARRARVPRHRRARGAPHPRRPAHDRPGGRRATGSLGAVEATLAAVRELGAPFEPTPLWARADRERRGRARRSSRSRSAASSPTRRPTTASPRARARSTPRRDRRSTR